MAAVPMRTPLVWNGERLSRDAVLIQRNTAAVQFLLYLTSGKSGIRQIQQKQMVVRAAGNDLVAHGHELRRHRPAVDHHTVDIRPVLRGQRLLRSHRLAGDHVLQRAALHTGKNGAVHLFRQLRPQKISPPRGPRSVLCVVVVTTSASPKGLGCSPAATSPAM